MRQWLYHMAEMLLATYLITECCSLSIQINSGQGEEKIETTKSKTVGAVMRNLMHCFFQEHLLEC